MPRIATSLFAAVLAACSNLPEKSAGSGKSRLSILEYSAPKLVPQASEASPLGIGTAPQSKDPAPHGKSLAQIIAGPHRAAEHVALDPYRPTLEVLQFFDARPGKTIVEILPGTGYYSEILAPLSKGKGAYIAALLDENTDAQSAHFAATNKALEAKFRAAPEHFNHTQVHRFNPRRPRFGTPSSAGLVLSFYAAHDWIEKGTAAAYFQACAEVLKPGGMLGLIDFRTPTGAPTDGARGYVTEQQVIDLARTAGFVLEGRSEIHANQEDARKFAMGGIGIALSHWHWMEPVPVSLKYAIAERGSDRMTLKFLRQ